MENEELLDPISTTMAEVVQPRASAAQPAQPELQRAKMAWGLPGFLMTFLLTAIPSGND